jgi:malate synthase
MPWKLPNRGAGKMPARRAPSRAGRMTSRFFSRSWRSAMILRNPARLMTRPAIALRGISAIETIYANLFDRIHNNPCGEF